MTKAGLRTADPGRNGGGEAAATVEVVIPVLNEARALPGSVAVLRSYLDRHFPFEWAITVVDNGSTDGTWRVATELCRADRRVRALHLDARGRGLALRAAWAQSSADIVAYMDVDLSTDLRALLPLVAPLVSDHSDLAIGSRLAAGARAVRGPRRELISRCYNALLRLTHGVSFTDAQCGFKAARREAVLPLLERVRDGGWFFDTELLLLAEHNGLRVHEVPVDWVEDTDSRVDVLATAWHDLKGLVRVARAKATGQARVRGLTRRPPPRPQHPDAVTAPERGALLWQVLSFAAIGTVSTMAAATLYALLRTWWPPLLANLGALTIATLLNTEANRRLTFVGTRTATATVHLQGLIVFALYYAFTSGALLALQALAPSPGRWVEVAVLLAASALGTVGRFVLLRAWLFRPREGV
jgi:putative flippase GtrA